MIGFTFFASGYTAAVTFYSFLHKEYVWGIVMAIFTIVNLILGVNG